MGHPVIHFEIAGDDSRRLQEFYGNLFEWKVAADNPMGYGFVDTGDEKGIKGGITRKHGEMPNYVTIYVQVADLEAHLKKAESLGGRTLLPPTSVPMGGSFALFADPEGNVVGLWRD